MLARVGAKVSGRDSKVTTALSNKMRAGFVNFQGRFFWESQLHFSENLSFSFWHTHNVVLETHSFLVEHQTLVVEHIRFFRNAGH